MKMQLDSNDLFASDNTDATAGAGMDFAPYPEGFSTPPEQAPVETTPPMIQPGATAPLVTWTEVLDQLSQNKATPDDIKQAQDRYINTYIPQYLADTGQSPDAIKEIQAGLTAQLSQGGVQGAGVEFAPLPEKPIKTPNKRQATTWETLNNELIQGGASKEIIDGFFNDFINYTVPQQAEALGATAEDIKGIQDGVRQNAQVKYPPKFESAVGQIPLTDQIGKVVKPPESSVGMIPLTDESGKIVPRPLIAPAPEVAPTTIKNIASTAGAGLLKSSHDLVSTVNKVITLAPARLIDSIDSALSGKTQTGMVDWAAAKFVDPITIQDGFYNLTEAEQNNPAIALPYAITSALGLMPQIIATAPIAGEQAAVTAATRVSEMLAGSIERGAKVMSPTAIVDGVNTAQSVLDKGGTLDQALRAGTTAAMTTLATGSLPIAAEGGLIKRAVTGAGLGVGQGELHREVGNAAVPEAPNLQTPLTPEGVVTSAVTGAAVGAALGHRPETARPLIAPKELPPTTGEAPPPAGETPPPNAPPPAPTQPNEFKQVIAKIAAAEETGEPVSTKFQPQDLKETGLSNKDVLYRALIGQEKNSPETAAIIIDYVAKNDLSNDPVIVKLTEKYLATNLAPEVAPTNPVSAEILTDALKGLANENQTRGVQAQEATGSAATETIVRPNTTAETVAGRTGVEGTENAPSSAAKTEQTARSNPVGVENNGAGNPESGNARGANTGRAEERNIQPSVGEPNQQPRRNESVAGNPVGVRESGRAGSAATGEAVNAATGVHPNNAEPGNTESVAGRKSTETELADRLREAIKGPLKKAGEPANNLIAEEPASKLAPKELIAKKGTVEPTTSAQEGATQLGSYGTTPKAAARLELVPRADGELVLHKGGEPAINIDGNEITFKKGTTSAEALLAIKADTKDMIGTPKGAKFFKVEEPKVQDLSGKSPESSRKRLDSDAYDFVFNKLLPDYEAGTLPKPIKERVSTLLGNLLDAFDAKDYTSAKKIADKLYEMKRTDLLLNSAKRTPLKRGEANLIARTNKAFTEDKLSEYARDFVTWLRNKNPDILKQLAVSVGQSPEYKAAAKRGELNTVNRSGEYKATRRLINLFEGVGDSTAVHEVLHHLERMLPPDTGNDVRKLYVDRLNKATDAAAEAVKSVKQEIKDTAKIENADEADKALETLNSKLTDANELVRYFDAVKNGDYAKAMESLNSQKIKRDNYQYMNPSEFWAVNLTDILGKRFDAFQDGLGARVKQWLGELLTKIKQYFGADTNAPMVKALDQLLKNGTGDFVKDAEMLMKDQQIGYNAMPKAEAEKSNAQVNKEHQEGASIGAAVRRMQDESKIVMKTGRQFATNYLDRLLPFADLSVAMHKAGLTKLANELTTLDQLSKTHAANDLKYATDTFGKPLTKVYKETFKKFGKTSEQMNEFILQAHAEGRAAYFQDYQQVPELYQKAVEAEAAAKAYLDHLQQTEPEFYNVMIEKVIPAFKEFTDNTLAIRVKYGLLSEKEADKLANTYGSERTGPLYVPFQTDENFTSSGRQAMGVNFTGTDPFGRVQAQLQGSIAEGIRNQLKQFIYVAANMKDIVDEGGKKIVEIAPIKSLGRDAQGFVDYETKNYVNDPNAIVTYFNGKPIAAILKDPAMLSAVKSIPDEYKPDGLKAMISTVAFLTRAKAKVSTVFSPVFSITNGIFRDTYAVANNLPKDLSLPKTIAAWPGALADSFFGNTAELFGKEYGKYQDIKTAGALVNVRRHAGYMATSKAVLNELHPGAVSTGKLILKKADEGLTTFASILEDVNRIAVFKAAKETYLKKGFSEQDASDRAAIAAKNTTANFERDSNYGGKLGVFTMFAKPQIAGMRNYVGNLGAAEKMGTLGTQLLLRTKDTAYNDSSWAEKKGVNTRTAVVTGMMTLLGALATEYCNAKSDEGPDGKTNCSRVSDFVKDKSVFLLPNGFAWPMQPGEHMGYVFGNAMADYMSGRVGAGESAARLLKNSVDAFSPFNNPQASPDEKVSVGWTDYLAREVLGGALGSVIMDKMTNRDTFGNEIVPTKGPLAGGLNHLNASANEAEMSKALAKSLYDYTGGKMDVSPAWFTYGAKYLGGSAYRDNKFIYDAMTKDDVEFMSDQNPLAKRLTATPLPFKDKDEFDMHKAALDKLLTSFNNMKKSNDPNADEFYSQHKDEIDLAKEFRTNAAQISKSFVGFDKLSKEEKASLNEAGQTKKLILNKKYNDMRQGQ